MPRRHVHTAHKIPAAAAVRGPKVLLVTDSELQSGMSSLMLPAFLGQPNSLVLLTQSAREGSAAAALAAQPTPVQVELTTLTTSPPHHLYHLTTFTTSPPHHTTTPPHHHLPLPKYVRQSTIKKAAHRTTTTTITIKQV